MNEDNNNYPRVVTRSVVPFMLWLGGAVHTASLPGFNFWDGLIWFYYVGRYIAAHFGAGA